MNGTTVTHPRYGIGNVEECYPALLPGRDPATCKVRFDQDAKYNCARRVRIEDLKPAMRTGVAPAPRPPIEPVRA